MLQARSFVGNKMLEWNCVSFTSSPSSLLRPYTTNWMSHTKSAIFNALSVAGQQDKRSQRKSFGLPTEQMSNIHVQRTVVLNVGLHRCVRYLSLSKNLTWCVLFVAFLLLHDDMMTFSLLRFEHSAFVLFKAFGYTYILRVTAIVDLLFVEWKGTKMNTQFIL